MKIIILIPIFSFAITCGLQGQYHVELNGTLKLGVVDTVTEVYQVMAPRPDGWIAATYTSTGLLPTPQYLPLSQGFFNRGIGWQECIYYKFRDRVYIDGTFIKNGPIADGDTIAMLPLGYRPARRVLVNAVQAADPLRLNIEPDGAIRVVIGADGSSNWASLDGISFYKEEYAVGDFFAGGYVFYMADPPADLNGDGTPDRGLVAAPFDQSDLITYGCFGTNILGAGGIPIGKGAKNTMAIINNCVESPIAASICGELDVNGYDDWFLPSRDELAEMFITIGPGIDPNNNISGLKVGTRYWSSTQLTLHQAYVFSTNGSPSLPKSDNYAVRAVRAF